MAVGEVFPALQTAEKTVKISPTWWVGHQTLGRALANVGEVKMVCAVHVKMLLLDEISLHAENVSVLSSIVLFCMLLTI